MRGRVNVAHRGANIRMTHDRLNVLDVSSAVRGPRPKRMTQVVKAEVLNSCLAQHRSPRCLDIAERPSGFRVLEQIS